MPSLIKSLNVEQKLRFTLMISTEHRRCVGFSSGIDTAEGSIAITPRMHVIIQPLIPSPNRAVRPSCNL